MAMSVTFTNFGGRVVHENRGGVERDYVRDPLGNTVALVDMSGNVTDTYSYWPYGETRVHSGTATTQLTFLGTLGYFLDYAAKLYVRARHLRPDLARWMTVDPLWLWQKAFCYADGQPVTGVDPSGLSALVIGGIILSEAELVAISALVGVAVGILILLAALLLLLFLKWLCAKAKAGREILCQQNLPKKCDPCLDSPDTLRSKRAAY